MVVEVDDGGQRRVQPPGAGGDEWAQSGLERLVNALELSLGLRVMGHAVDVPDAEGAQIGFERLGQRPEA